MPAAPNISEAEWEVIKVIWDSGPLTAGQIVASLEGQKLWRPYTWEGDRTLRCGCRLSRLPVALAHLLKQSSCPPDARGRTGPASHSPAGGSDPDSRSGNCAKSSRTATSLIGSTITAGRGNYSWNRVLGLRISGRIAD